MCHFIYLVLPAGVDVSGVRRIAKNSGRALEPVTGHPSSAKLDPNETMFRTTSSMCDCGTCLGSATAGSSEAADYGAELLKLEKKGWSKAKIDRWRLAKVTTDRRAKDQKNAARRTKAVTWVDLLRQCVELSRPEPIGLLLAWEGGSTRDMRPWGRAEKIAVAEVTPAFLMRLTENCIYEIGP